VHEDRGGWRRGELLVYTIEATAFLRHMVRNIIGTLVEVGRGLRAAESFKELLEARDRSKAGATDNDREHHFTSGHSPSFNGRNAWSAGIVARTL